jgi:hypothetical protein
MNILHCYQPHYKTVSQPPGFADFVIGTMSLFCFNQHENVFVDYSRHPISNFLTNKHSTSEQQLFDSEIHEMFNCGQEAVTFFVKEQTQDIKIATNTRGYVLTENLRLFIKETFKPNTFFSSHIEQSMSELNLVDFETIHIRMGDYNMFKDLPQYELVLNTLVDNISPSCKYFITSDNKFVKQLLTKKNSLLLSNNNTPIHLGDLNNADATNVQGTLLDYFMMSKSKRITCYSVYGGSGFSQVCSDIYDIPYNVYKI